MLNNVMKDPALSRIFRRKELSENPIYSSGDDYELGI